MNKKEKDTLLKEAGAAIDVIKAQCEHDDVIGYYDIAPINSNETDEEIGYGVQVELNTRYGYAASRLTELKQLLKAKDFFIFAKDGILSVTFAVIYKKDGNQ